MPRSDDQAEWMSYVDGGSTTLFPPAHSAPMPRPKRHNAEEDTMGMTAERLERARRTELREQLAQMPCSAARGAQRVARADELEHVRKLLTIVVYALAPLIFLALVAAASSAYLFVLVMRLSQALGNG